MQAEKTVLEIHRTPLHDSAVPVGCGLLCPRTSRAWERPEDLCAMPQLSLFLAQGLTCGHSIDPAGKDQGTVVCCAPDFPIHKRESREPRRSFSRMPPERSIRSPTCATMSSVK